MNRAILDALLDAPGGRNLVWNLVESERADQARERADQARERASLTAEISAFAAERSALAAERSALAASWDRERAARAAENAASAERSAVGWDRERAMLIEREEATVAAVQKELDFLHGLVTVRAALEGIVMSRFKGTNATDALSRFCSAPDYLAYLSEVSDLTGFSVTSLAKAAKDSYGSLSATIHGGSTHVSGGDVPEAVLGDKRSLYGVAAIFKLARRNIRFYVGGTNATIKLPSPPPSPPGTAAPTAAPSAAHSPPKDAATSSAAQSSPTGTDAPDGAA